MKVVSFKSDHLSYLCSWLEKREKPTDVYIPKVGVIVRENGNYIACGFLKQVEGNTGVIDLLASNPDQPPEKRDEALHLVSLHLIDKAKNLGLLGIYAHSTSKSTIERAQSLGFSVAPHTVITLDLSNKD